MRGGFSIEKTRYDLGDRVRERILREEMANINSHSDGMIPPSLAKLSTINSYNQIQWTRSRNRQASIKADRERCRDDNYDALVSEQQKCDE